MILQQIINHLMDIKHGYDNLPGGCLHENTQYYFKGLDYALDLLLEMDDEETESIIAEYEKNGRHL